MKIGLYFGTFNPVHIGHMIIAQYMLEYSDLDEVWFIVTPHNPFKKKNTLLDDRQRLHMVHLAIGDQFKLRASDIEFGLEQPSYTINTLTHLQQKYPDKQFALIMGQDNLGSFHKWKDYEKILEKCALYVYPRPGAEASQFDDYPEVHPIEAPLMELSSTQIREAVKDGKDVSYMLPPAVWEYIGQCGFYK